MLEFAHPAMLWGLPLALVPVLIHLLNRRRYVRVRWAAMDYLLRAERESRRRVRWRNALLLAMRALAVAALVVLFARPAPTGLLAGGTRAFVVLVDDSASMAQEEGGVSAFDRARQAAVALARRLATAGAGGAVYLATEDEPFVREAPLTAAGVAELERRLAGLRPAAYRFRPADRLARLPGFAAGLGESVRFVILSDLRAADWGEAELLPPVRQALDALQRRGRVMLMDVGFAPSSNAGVVGIAGADRPVYARSAATFSAVVRNHDGPERAAGELGVRLLGPAAGQLPGVPLPAVPRGAQREVPFDVYLDAPDGCGIEAALRGSDSFPPDDRRCAALEAVRDLPVLVVEGQEAGAPGAGGRPQAPARYLRAALQPLREGGPGLRPEVVAAHAGPPADLRRYAAVFLCALSRPGPWADALATYAREGGRVVAFLDPETDPSAWEESLLAAPGGLVPCRLTGPAVLAPDAGRRPAWLAPADPLMKPFAGWEGVFQMVRVWGCWRAEPLGETQALVRLDDPGGSPLVLAARAGAGTAVLVTTTADDTWTDWPRSEAGRVTYLALVQWLVEQARPAARADLNLAGGARLALRLDAGRFQPTAVLRPPAGASARGGGQVRLRAEEREGAEGLWFVSGPLVEAGLWEVELTGMDGSRRPVYFAVNVPDEEALLRKCSPAAFAGLPRDSFSLVAAGAAGDVLAGASAPGRWWTLMAGSIVALLVAESALARAFGNPRVRPLEEAP
jgi:hypothetical protein